jgi:hypothetical protein
LELLAPDEIVEEIGGAYSYYCYVLADFDPIRAKELEANTTIEEITFSMMAKHRYYMKEED